MAADAVTSHFKMNRIFLLLLSVFLAGFARAQDAPLKRTAYTLKIPISKNKVYEEAIPEGPFVLPDKTIMLYAGESVNIEVDQTEGVVNSFRAVATIKDSAKTITLAFTQSVNNKKHEMMMLSVRNPFAWPLTYQANIFLLRQEKWVTTNVVPVLPGLMSYETWPDPIVSIGIGKLAFKK